MTPDMPLRAALFVALLAVTGLVWAAPAGAQTVAGRVTDQTGGVLPGVSVGLVTAAGAQTAVTDVGRLQVRPRRAGSRGADLPPDQLHRASPLAGGGRA